MDNDEGADGPLMTEDDVVSAIAKDGHVPVLLTGQSGTERERMGRYLHRKGPRSNGPFVAMRCETVHDGSFAETILSADGGTLYLEAIDKLPPAFQAKLTEVLREDRVLLPGSKSEKRFDVRFIFSADGDLRPKVRGGTFREDLYYRMSVTQLHLPLGTRAEER